MSDRRVNRSPSRSPELGPRIVASRLERGLAQTALARRAGLAPSYLSCIETGRVQPSVPMAARIARGLGVSLGDLLGPSPAAPKRRCPASEGGECLVDLVATRSSSWDRLDRESFTPRELRLLRSFGVILRRSSPMLLRSLEGLVAQTLAGRPSAHAANRRQPSGRLGKRARGAGPHTTRRSAGAPRRRG